MTSHLRLFPAVAVLMWFMAAVVCRAETHVFTTTEGRYIRGELTDANGDQVVVRSSEGQALTLPLKSLIGADQDYVALRVKGRDPEHHENFDVTWTKEKTSSKVETVKHTKTTKNTYVAHIKIRNRSDQASGDLDLHYQLHYTFTDLNLRKAVPRHKDGVVKLPSLPAGATTTVDAGPLEMDYSELIDGYAYVNGAPTRQVDSFKGLVVTFMLKNKQVFEYVAPGTTKAQ